MKSTTKKLLVPHKKVSRMGEEFERQQDLEFAANFTWEKDWEAIEKLNELLKKRGWSVGSDGGQYKDGVELCSEDAAFKDKLAFATEEKYLAMEKLSDLVKAADTKTLRSLRIAFEAGQSQVEATAYQWRESDHPGAPKTKEEQDNILFENAFRKWSTDHPGITKKPKWGDFWNYVCIAKAVIEQGQQRKRKLVNVTAKEGFRLWWKRHDNINRGKVKLSDKP